MAKKMFKIDRVDWCKPDQLHKIVAALSYHQKRKTGGYGA
jgi:phage gp16-like protein